MELGVKNYISVVDFHYMGDLTNYTSLYGLSVVVCLNIKKLKQNASNIRWWNERSGIQQPSVNLTDVFWNILTNPAPDIPIPDFHLVKPPSYFDGKSLDILLKVTNVKFSSI